MKQIEISFENITNNINEVKNLQPDKEIMVVIKGNAYGHGVKEVATSLLKLGINYFCVATLDEAIELRQQFKEPKILVLYGIWDQDITLFKKYDIELTISNFQDWQKHHKYILENDLKMHLKFDSGMNRMGFKNPKELNEIKNELKANHKSLRGLYTHIAQYEVSYQTAQHEVSKFEQVVKSFNDIKIDYIHYMNSASIQMFKTNFDNAIRIGNFLYGYYDFDRTYAKNHLAQYDIYENLNIKPILRLATKIKNIKHVKKGEFIGYGNTISNHDCNICFVDWGKLDGIINNLKHPINVNNKIRYNITNPAMNHMFIELDKDDQIGDNIYLYEDLNIQAQQLNCRPIDFIAYLDTSIKRKLVKSFKQGECYE